MTSVQRVYLFLALGILGLAGYWYSTYGDLQTAREHLNKYKKIHQENLAAYNRMYQHQYIIEWREKQFGQDATMDYNRILELANKHNLGTPDISSVSHINRPTYQEELRKIKFTDKKLKDVILFLLDVENSNDSRTKSLRLSRNSKNKDLWDANIAISQMAPKELPQKKSN